MTEFTHNVTVYYEDTDAAGFVYHSQYLNFAERARTEVMLSQGMTYMQLVKNFGGFFVVRSAKVDYLAPAKLNDKLVLKSRVREHKGARVHFEQNIYKDDQVICHLDIETVFISDETGKPLRLPEPVMRLLNIIEEDEE